MGVFSPGGPNIISNRVNISRNVLIRVESSLNLVPKAGSYGPDARPSMVRDWREMSTGTEESFHWMLDPELEEMVPCLGSWISSSG